MTPQADKLFHFSDKMIAELVRLVQHGMANPKAWLFVATGLSRVFKCVDMDFEDVSTQTAPFWALQILNHVAIRYVYQHGSSWEWRDQQPDPLEEWLEKHNDSLDQWTEKQRKAERQLMQSAGCIVMNASGQVKSRLTDSSKIYLQHLLEKSGHSKNPKTGQDWDFLQAEETSDAIGYALHVCFGNQLLTQDFHRKRAVSDALDSSDRYRKVLGEQGKSRRYQMDHQTGNLEEMRKTDRADIDLDGVILKQLVRYLGGAKQDEPMLYGVDYGVPGATIVLMMDGKPIKIFKDIHMSVEKFRREMDRAMAFSRNLMADKPMNKPEHPAQNYLEYARHVSASNEYLARNIIEGKQAANHEIAVNRAAIEAHCKAAGEPGIIRHADHLVASALMDDPKFQLSPGIEDVSSGSQPEETGHITTYGSEEVMTVVDAKDFPLPLEQLAESRRWVITTLKDGTGLCADDMATSVTQARLEQLLKPWLDSYALRIKVEDLAGIYQALVIEQVEAFTARERERMLSVVQTEFWMLQAWSKDIGIPMKMDHEGTGCQSEYTIDTAPF